MQDDEALVHVGDEVQRPTRDPRLGERPDNVEAVPGGNASVRPHITEVANHFLALSTSEAHGVSEYVLRGIWNERSA